jgi:hypothetical protein
MSDCRMSHTRRFFRLLFAAALSLSATHQSEATSPAAPLSDLEDRLAPDYPDMRTIVSPDWAELVPPSNVAQETPPKSFAVITPSAQQPQGVLSGKIVFMNSGHGWTHDPAFSPPWRLQRGVGNVMNEDYGNLFVSGADVANDLDRASVPTAADRTFLHNQLHAAFTNDNSTSYTGTSVPSGITCNPLTPEITRCLSPTWPEW